MNPIARIKNYVLESYAEMRKVTWPSRQQTISYSVLVIVLTVGLAVFFAALDYGFNSGIGKIITK